MYGFALPGFGLGSRPQALSPSLIRKRFREKPDSAPQSKKSRKRSTTRKPKDLIAPSDLRAARRASHSTLKKIRPRQPRLHGRLESPSYSRWQPASHPS
jgi:hypothetical protein